MSIRDLAQAFRSRQLSPVEVVQERIAGLDDWQRRTRLFVRVDPEAALQEARESEARYAAGRPLSPLDGILVGLKDLIDVAGQVTTAGSAVRQGARAAHDAPVVDRLRQAGANMALGKLNLHEFAYGPTGTSSFYGAVGNPYDPRLMAGGSSSGSAVAVASGLMSAALGTDTGGSIRIPAAFCGLSGLKPTWGSVSTEGVVPLAWSLDHVGPLARSVSDLQMVHQVLVDRPWQPDPVPRRPRLFWPESHQIFCYESGLDAYVADAWTTIAQELGAEVVRGLLPDLEQIWLAQSIVLGSEALAYHWNTLREHAGQYQPDVAERLQRGGAHLAVEYVAALRYRQEAAARYDAWMRSFDAVVLPTVPIRPPSLAMETWHGPAGHEEDVRAVVTRFTNPFNFLGLPALSIPWGQYQGLPVGLQLVGRRHRDASLVALGQHIQDRFPESLPAPPPGALV